MQSGTGRAPRDLSFRYGRKMVHSRIVATARDTLLRLSKVMGRPAADYCDLLQANPHTRAHIHTPMHTVQFSTVRLFLPSLFSSYLLHWQARVQVPQTKPTRGKH